MRQQDVEEDDKDWLLVQSPQEAQRMLEYVTNAFTGSFGKQCLGVDSCTGRQHANLR